MQSDYYTFTGATITRKGKTLHQIEATRNIDHIRVNTGDIGGYIEHPENLTEESWVTPGAEVYGNARVQSRSLVTGKAVVCDDANISESIIAGMSIVNKRATVTEKSIVNNQAYITDDATITRYSLASGNAVVTGRSTVSNISVVEGETRLEDNARVAYGSWVSGDYVLRDPSHCMMHTITTPNISAEFTLARGESGEGLVRIHEAEMEHPIPLNTLTMPKMMKMLRDPSLYRMFGAEMSHLDAVEFIDEFRLMHDMFAARVARWR